MTAGAWAMFLVGAITLWGGFAYFLLIAYKAEKKGKA
ncbi:MetS family NSS transporter small subunit [Melghirimyces algeriensis]|uniref:MetS family NSS transporter small subunit n=1 Tax=Melghirimyces algeriensis TaxID=910412 RepID=A0A521EIP6_9BACL|nr:MetS family NSS transporter small subunit [Melghirimyces algeriensis]SMO83785.1 hypothetical protein SAMN06264849_10989 [Melghirimyces algeriensis]